MTPSRDKKETRTAALKAFADLFESFGDSLSTWRDARAPLLEESWREYFGDDSPSLRREADRVLLSVLDLHLKISTLLMETRLQEILPEAGASDDKKRREADAFRADAEARLMGLYDRIRSVRTRLEYEKERNPLVERFAALQQPESEEEEMIFMPPEEELAPPPADIEDMREELEQSLSAGEEVEPPSIPEEDKKGEEEEQAAPVDETPEEPIEAAVSVPDLKQEIPPALDLAAYRDITKDTNDTPFASRTDEALFEESEEVTEKTDEEPAAETTETAPPAEINAEEPEKHAAPQDDAAGLVTEPAAAASRASADMVSADEENPFAVDQPEREALLSDSTPGEIQEVDAATIEADLPSPDVFDDESEADSLSDILEPPDELKSMGQPAQAESIEDKIRQLAQLASQRKRVHRDPADLRVKTSQGSWTLSLPFYQLQGQNGSSGTVLDMESFVGIHKLAIKGILDFARKSGEQERARLARMISRLQDYFIRLYDNIYAVVGSQGSRILPSVGDSISGDDILMFTAELHVRRWKEVADVEEFQELFAERIAGPFTSYITEPSNQLQYLKSIVPAAEQ